MALPYRVHHGPKSLNAMVLQRPVTTGSFVGGIMMSGIDRWGPCVEAYDGDIVMIDSTCVRLHQHGSTSKKGIPAMVA